MSRKIFPAGRTAATTAGRSAVRTAGQTAALRQGDLWALAGYAAFAATLLAPLRHYVGDLRTVTKAKIEEDSFPLSTYPMFSADRKGRIVIPHVVGFTAAGERIVPHYSHFGSGGLNQVRKQIARGIRQGQAVEIAQQYADSIAKQQRRTSVPSKPEVQRRHECEAEIVTVAVVRARYVFDDYFADDKNPAAEVIHAECPVGGTAFAHPAKQLPKHRPAKHGPVSTPASPNHTAKPQLSRPQSPLPQPGKHTDASAATGQPAASTSAQKAQR